MNVNLLPFPTSLSTQIFPPCNSTILFAMASPRPVPPFFCAGGALGLAELFKNFFLIRLGDARPGIRNGNHQRSRLSLPPRSEPRRSP